MDAREKLIEAVRKLETVCQELANGAPANKERIVIMSKTVRAVGYLLGDASLATSASTIETDPAD